MTTTEREREAARQPTGRFGAQSRNEAEVKLPQDELDSFLLEPPYGSADDLPAS